jgi:hypothetical protein
MPVPMLLFQGALLAHLVAPPLSASPAYPFAVGERLDYEATVGVVPVGSATIVVNPMATEQGHQAFVFAATGEARPLGLKFGAELTSYVGVEPFNSLRFHRKLIQGSSVNDVQFQIVPDSGPRASSPAPPTASHAISRRATTRCRCASRVGRPVRCPAASRCRCSPSRSPAGAIW